MKYRLKTTPTKGGVVKAGLKAGDIVYRANCHDYGLANMDSLAFGERFVSVTLDPHGGAPLFTAPESDLEAV